MVYAVKIKYTWTQHTQKTENNANRKRPAISNNVLQDKNQTVSLMCRGEGTAVSSYKLCLQLPSKEKKYKYTLR